MYNPFSLTGKTILVTGASSGIGRSVAVECSKMGAKLVITGRNKDRLEETFHKLEGGGHQIIIGDLLKNEDMNEISETVPEIDGLVYSAGIFKLIPFRFLNSGNINDVMGINFGSALGLTQKLIKAKKIRKNSSLIYLSSVSGILCSSPGGSIYSASKGALSGLIKGMALDFAPNNIRVNSIAPGMVETSMFSDGILSEDQLRDGVNSYPLKRYGKAEEVAYAAIYLLSDASAWITGTNLIIDGGLTLL